MDPIEVEEYSCIIVNDFPSYWEFETQSGKIKISKSGESNLFDFIENSFKDYPCIEVSELKEYKLGLKRENESYMKILLIDKENFIERKIFCIEKIKNEKTYFKINITPDVSSSFVGIFPIGNLIFKIHPSKKKGFTLREMFYMLGKVLQSDNKRDFLFFAFMNEIINESNNYPLWDVLALLLLSYLNILITKGFLFVYEDFEEIESKIKGRILFERYIKNYLLYPHKIPLGYSLLHYDNQFNQTIKCSINRIIGFVNSNQIRKRLIQFLIFMQEIKDKVITPIEVKDLKKKTKFLNPLFKETYDKLINLCAKIINVLPPVIPGERELYSFSIPIIVSMEKLFERYITVLLSECENLTIKPQKRFSIQNLNRHLFYLIPDIVAYSDTHCTAIDVKYKQYLPDMESNALEDDLKQIVIYRHLLKENKEDAKLPQGILIFSLGDFSENVIVDTIKSKENGEYLANIICFRNRESLEQDIKETEKKFIERLLEVISNY